MMPISSASFQAPGTPLPAVKPVMNEERGVPRAVAGNPYKLTMLDKKALRLGLQGWRPEKIDHGLPFQPYFQKLKVDLQIASFGRTHAERQKRAYRRRYQISHPL